MKNQGYSLYSSMNVIIYSGFLSKRGSNKTILWLSSLALLIASPIFIHMMVTASLPVIYLLMIILSFFYGMFVGSILPGLPTLFPKKIRYTCFAVGYTMSATLLGGTVPFIATAFLYLSRSPSIGGAMLSVYALIAFIGVILFSKAPKYLR